ncbi:MAG: hypothetical protein V3V99_06920 [candidate division Zixibacteria bacterium]
MRKPHGFVGSVFRVIRKILFKKVYMFVEHFRNTEGYEKYFGIRKSQFMYIPFKINSYELILNTTIFDEGYIFSGGNSLRDYPTLIEAVEDLDIPVKIVTQPNDIIKIHGTFVDESKLPTNIEVIRHDGNQKSFINFIAGSRLAVIPLKKDTIAAAGISVYLMCMALRKCTILSDLPGVSDVLDKDQAIIVPPEKPDILRQEIIKTYNDNIYRSKYEDNGYRYAIGLKGERQLFRSIAQMLVDDFNENKKYRSGYRR